MTNKNALPKLPAHSPTEREKAQALTEIALPLSRPENNNPEHSSNSEWLHHNSGTSVGTSDILNWALNNHLITSEQQKMYDKPNEDRALRIRETGIMAVLDGVGGNGAGAAELLKEIFQEWLVKIPKQISAENLRNYLESMLLAGNKAVKKLQKENNNPSLDTTFAAMIPFTHTDGKRYIATASVGDSSVLAFYKDGSGFKFLNNHDGVLSSPDLQSKLQTLEKAPVFADPDNPSSDELLLEYAWNKRHIITATMGGFDTNKTGERIQIYPYNPDMVYILTTDGLPDNLSAKAINDIIQRHLADGAAVITRFMRQAVQDAMFARDKEGRGKLDDLTFLIHVSS